MTVTDNSRAAREELRHLDGSPVRVLVVDDEPTLDRPAVDGPSLRGMGRAHGRGRDTAIAYAREFRPDAVVLDMMLPGLRRHRGAASAPRGRRRRTRPVPDRKDAVDDRVAGLTAGGDDYVTKPFSLEEVVARVRGLMRRAGVVVARASVRC